MLSLNNYLIYNDIVGEDANNEMQYTIINESFKDFAKKILNNIEANVLDITIAVAWAPPPVEFDITLGFPINGLTIADAKGNDIISGKDLLPIIQAFSDGNYMDIGKELVTLFQKYSEDFAKTIKKGKDTLKELEEGTLDLTSLAFMFKIDRARIYIPYTGKFSKLGVKFYQEFTIHFLMKPDPKDAVAGALGGGLVMIPILLDRIKKIELNDFVIKGIGRVNVTKLLKIYLQCAVPIAQLILGFVMLVLGQVNNGEPIKPDELVKKLQPMIKKTIKSSINSIKKLPDAGEFDSDILKTIKGATLDQIASSKAKKLSIK